MAGDWIKVRDDLPDDIEVIRMASMLGISQDTVVGKLIRFWAWVDRHMIDGHAVGVTNVFIDEYVRHDGFAKILAKVGWLSFNSEGFDIPNFERHMSENAKIRALANERKIKERSRSKRDKSVTREEKRRDDVINPTSPIEIPSELKELSLYRQDQKLCARWSILFETWHKCYPGVDILFEVQQAHAWELSNPTRVKINRSRFLNSWFKRVQDNGGSNGHVEIPSKTKEQRDSELLDLYFQQHPDVPGSPYRQQNKKTPTP